MKKQQIKVWLPLLIFAVIITGTLSSPIAAEVVKPVAAPLAKKFQLADIKLLAGPFKTGQQAAVDYLLRLEPDRLLAGFREESGLDSKARRYGGWESQGIAGHSGGHYLSACAMAYAATGDPRFLERVNYIVEELAECQAANGTGYVAAIPDGKRIYAEISAGDIRSAGFDLNGCWVPNYTMHKVLAGLLDAYQLCDNQQALKVAMSLADWFETTHAKLSEKQMQKILVTEHGGINESFVLLYGYTSDERYLKLSQRFHHRAILAPLAKGIDILPGKHANTQIPKITGVAARYELTGNKEDRAIADFFWERVVNHHSYVTGGHCNFEYFGEPDKLNHRLSPSTTETCNVYNMLKLSEHVFGWNPDVQVADFYERALLNHIRSSQHPDGRLIYNLSLLPGHYKDYQTPFDSFTCCVGSGMENHVKYGSGIYFHDTDGLWVNLFIPSELNWEERGVQIKQETGWPFADSTTLNITAEQPQEFVLRIRKPYWAENGLQIQVNGQPWEFEIKGAGYAEINRTWKTGDQVDVRFAMSLRTESMPDNPNRFAIFYGPTLLAAVLGEVNDSAASEPNYVPVLVTNDLPVADWVKPVSLAEQTFATEAVGRPREVKLVPFFNLHDHRYTVYFDKFTSAEWEKRSAEILARRKREAELDRRTLDVLRIGEMQSERDHLVTGEKTSAGDAFGRKWRHAADGGWFAFDLKVDPKLINELHFTYWGGEGSNRVFDILVDGKKIATQRLLQNKPGEFFDVDYTLSQEVTAGKDKVNVRFQAHEGALAGGLFGARSLTQE